MHHCLKIVLKKVGNRFLLVNMVAKRVRQICARAPIIW